MARLPYERLNAKVMKDGEQAANTSELLQLGALKQISVKQRSPVA